VLLEKKLIFKARETRIDNVKLEKRVNFVVEKKKINGICDSVVSLLEGHESSEKIYEQW